MMPWWPRLAVAGMIAGGWSAAQAELVDRIAAVVNGHLITVSDLAGYRTLFASDRSQDQAVDVLIDRQLLIEEADRFAIDQPSPSAIDQRVQDTVTRLGGEAAFRQTLERVGWTSDVLRAWIAEDLRIADFLQQRIDFFVVVPPDEVSAYYDAHADEFASVTPDQAREAVIRRLTQQRSDEKRRQFMSKLRDKAAIRVNPPSGPEESAPAQPVH